MQRSLTTSKMAIFVWSGGRSYLGALCPTRRCFTSFIILTSIFSCAKGMHAFTLTSSCSQNDNIVGRRLLKSLQHECPASLMLCCCKLALVGHARSLRNTRLESKSWPFSNFLVYNLRCTAGHTQFLKTPKDYSYV